MESSGGNEVGQLSFGQSIGLLTTGRLASSSAAKLALGVFVAVVTVGVASGCGGAKGGAMDSGVVGRADSASSGGAGGLADGGGSGGVGGGGDADGGVSAAIVVNTPSGVVASESFDGYCDILEAIEAVNTGKAVHECAAGADSNQIVLTGGNTYPTPKTLRFGVAISIGVSDPGRGNAVISATQGFRVDPADRWSSCLVYSAVKEGYAKMADVTLVPDASLDISGACVTRGFFELRRAHVTGFQESGIVGYCSPKYDCDHETSVFEATTIAVLGSLVDGNRSSQSGGGIFTEGSGLLLSLDHSAIVNNVAKTSGGGAYFGGGWGTQRLSNTTFSGNRATYGGGVRVSFTSCTATYLYVLNSTIANNTATESGGGISFDANHDPCYSHDVTVLASLVTNNAATATEQSNINADWTGGQFNCDRGSLIYVAPGLPIPSHASGTPCRFDVSDALLVPLMPMGGTGNLPVHALRRGSPAIDAALDDQADDQQRDFWIARYDDLSPPPWTVFDRVVDGDGDGMAIRDLGAYETNDVWQTELLTVAAKGAGTHEVVTSPDGFDRGAGTAYAAADATQQFVSYVLPIAEAGTYAISVGVKKASDAAQFQVTVADQPAVVGQTKALGTVQDTYAGSEGFAELKLTDGQAFATAGPKTFRFGVVGKNAMSLGYRLFLDYIKVSKLP